MNLNYFDLISPAPISIPHVGSILSPTLKDISLIGINTYNYFLSILLMDAVTYVTMTGQAEQYDALSDEEKARLHIFDLMTSNIQSADLLKNVLNFFIKETVVFSETDRCFFIVNSTENSKEDVQKSITGTVTRENYTLVCDFICQRNNLKMTKDTDLSKVKSKKAIEIIKKLQKGRTEKTNTAKADKNLELGNVISAVANKHPSLNIITIWDLTIYQLWDTFSRISNNSIYEIQSMSVAAWGNKDNHFDAAAWFQPLNTGN